MERVVRVKESSERSVLPKSSVLDGVKFTDTRIYGANQNVSGKLECRGVRCYGVEGRPGWSRRG